ncbi:hypothetical protein SAY87_013982 [Trapa incisa]|uniref:BHLH domain-containing protein n=1 Tax=Trapa incisa TaxID=236973 RepID=A0AAN7JD17_9MYRT|nr:hypothetical protein SAY87_013982 [Trapa incisa]
MALDALSSNEFLNFIIYDTISSTPNYSSFDSSDITPTLTVPTDADAPAAAFVFETNNHVLLDPVDQGSKGGGEGDGGGRACSGSPSSMNVHVPTGTKPNARKASLGAQQGRKKRRRRPKVCKNKEEAETQRMTHITVERNRRKQMNEHLAVLRSLMPESYVQRGDQASIVGGAIEFVKELEHLLQSLETQKLQQKLILEEDQFQSQASAEGAAEDGVTRFMTPPFSHFFMYPQYTWCQLPNNNVHAKYSASSSSSSSSSRTCSGANMVNNGGTVSGGGSAVSSVADIEVTLIETHANLRILSRKRPRQLSRLVAGFHTLHLSILHLNVATLHPLVLYSISAKVEEGSQLTTVDDIAGAVHHMLRIIEAEGALS